MEFFIENNRRFTIRMILIDDSGNCYAYYDRTTMESRGEWNFGKDGGVHWVEQIESKTKQELKKLYPHASIRDLKDSRTPNYIKSGIKELAI